MLSSSVWRDRGKYGFSAGLLIGGVISALGIMLLGSLLRWPLPVPVAAGLVIAWTAVILVRELGLVSFALPQNARLVPETVFRHGPVLGPMQFGIEMGTGMRNFVTSGLPYALLVALALVADPWQALLAGLGFGALMTQSSLGYGDEAEWDDTWVAHQRALHVALAALYALATAVVLAVPLGLTGLGE